MDHLLGYIPQQSFCFSIGILELEPPVAEAVEVLLRRTAVAAEHVNEHQRIGMETFSPGMEQREERDQIIRQGLTMAVLEDGAGEENSGLFVMVQPVVHADEAEIHGFEALARFRHPELGIVSPGEFIPLAETSQLMIPVGRRIIHRVCDFALLLDREGYPDIPISFNVSAIQLLIVADIISMAHKLGQEVVAEGVESETQRQYLEEHRCDYFQGYLFSRPLMGEEALKLLHEAKINA